MLHAKQVLRAAGKKDPARFQSSGKLGVEQIFGLICKINHHVAAADEVQIRLKMVSEQILMAECNQAFDGIFNLILLVG